MFSSREEKKKRPSVNRKDVLKLFGNKCKICGKSEKEVGKLVLAHFKAFSRRGNIVFPLCPTCHARFDYGQLKSAELKKIGLTKAEYEKYRPKERPSGAKPDEKYYFLWGDGKRRYKSEATLPEPACRPGRHSWEQSWVAGTYLCTKCKAKRVAI